MDIFMVSVSAEIYKTCRAIVNRFSAMEPLLRDPLNDVSSRFCSGIQASYIHSDIFAHIETKIGVESTAP